jgi:hypothetical protein
MQLKVPVHFHPTTMCSAVQCSAVHSGKKNCSVISPLSKRTIVTLRRAMLQVVSAYMLLHSSVDANFLFLVGKYQFLVQTY